MIFRMLDSEVDSSFIHETRKLTMTSLGLPADSPATKPLSHAIYIGLFSENDSRPCGLAEAYFLDQAYLSFETCIYKSPSFVKLCPFDQMSWIRTIYVDPEHRCHRPYYLYLYLVMAYIFNRLGASYAGMATRADDPYFHRLYLKTGGSLQGYTSAPFLEDGRFALYAFDLKRLLQHPRSSRTLQSLQLAWKKLREIRARKSSN